MSGEYYKTKESVAEYIRLADGVNGSALIERLQGFLPRNSVLLEIGSGPGTDWKILNKLYQVSGSDNSPEFISHLVADNPGAEFLELDASTLLTEKTFDGIYSNKVLHHLTDREILSSIQRQVKILNPGGIICHSFWRGEGTEIFNGLSVKYYSESDIEALFGEYFKILWIACYPEFEEDDSILTIGKKK